MIPATRERRLAKLGRFAWTLHNVVGHPLSEVLHQIGAQRASNWVHDVTMPKHEAGKGRD